MGRTVEWMDRTFYPRMSEYWDDEALRTRILSHVTKNSRLLDLGAGAGIVSAMNFRGLVAHVVGIDPDERVHENPYLDEAHVGAGEKLPFAEDTFDVVISDNVLEHLEHPVQVFCEVRRVLRPGGVFIAKTPNRHHYMPLIAIATPHSFHRWFNALRGRHSPDTFRTLYRANTARELRQISAATGFELESVEFVDGRPEYLRFSPPTYLVGVLYERIVRLQALRWLRIVLIATLRKPPQ